MKFPSNLNCDGKIVSEMGPWLVVLSDNFKKNKAGIIHPFYPLCKQSVLGTRTTCLPICQAKCSIVWTDWLSKYCRRWAEIFSQQPYRAVIYGDAASKLVGILWIYNTHIFIEHMTDGVRISNSAGGIHVQKCNIMWHCICEWDIEQRGYIFRKIEPLC